jgi:hypothetical protein
MIVASVVSLAFVGSAAWPLRMALSPSSGV